MEEENHQYNKRLWTEEEDKILMDHAKVHGKGQWNLIAKKTGLKRCGKSCRLRWLNYLSPNVKQGNFTEEEEDLIIRLHYLLGNRWALIAKRITGRTDNQVKNYINTHLSKKLLADKDIIQRLGIKQKCNRIHFSTSANPIAIQVSKTNTISDSTSCPYIAATNEIAVHKETQKESEALATQESTMEDLYINTFSNLDYDLEPSTLGMEFLYEYSFDLSCSHEEPNY